MAAIPHNDKLLGLPKTPFVGELTYGGLDPSAEAAAAKIHEAGEADPRPPGRISRIQAGEPA